MFTLLKPEDIKVIQTAITQMASNNVDAFDYRDFLPFYQPIVELATGKIAGYEALARCRRGDNAFVSAGAIFFDVSLSREKKLHLDRYLREKALQGFVDVKESNNSFITLNISPDWVDMLDENHHIPTLEMVKQLGIDPARVIIEITEHCGNLENLKKLTSVYHRAGLKVAIDDFGAGASQIDRVIELKPDFIKLDMGMFKSAARGGHAADIVLSIVAMAQRAGCKIICEGVESEEELYFAIECGADFIQGWLFDPALPNPIKFDCHMDSLNAMKASYLTAKSSRLRQAAQHNKEVANTLVTVCQSLSVNNPLSSIVDRLSIETAKQLGVLQLFLCDGQGNQISDNVCYRDDYLRFDPDSQGKNWSHRPYFPLLHAMNQLQSDHIVVSTPYRDINTGKLCKTHGLFIRSDCVLLIDVLVDDVILFSAK